VLSIRDLVITAGRPDDEIVLLRGADLDIPTGQTVVIHGEPGSGKSTLCAVLQRRISPRFGQIDGEFTVVDDADRLPPVRLQELVQKSREYGVTTVLLSSDTRIAERYGADQLWHLAKGMLAADPGTAQAQEELRLSPEELRRRASASLRAVGCRPDTAELVADVLVEADVRGHHSHGIGLLPTYLDRVRSGGINATAEPVLTAAGTTARVDAKAGFGQPAAAAAAEWCAEHAARLGVAAVGVHSNNHVGMMAAYRRPFQRHRVVGLLFNISGPNLAAPRAVRATLGSNAVCMVMPTSDDEPFVVDFATGVVAVGKIRAAAHRGMPVPDGWLQDRDGRPTNNPDELERGGSVPVFGDYKGLCVTLIAEVLAGMLGGHTVSPLVAKQRAQPGQPMNCSQLFIGLSPSAFGLEETDKLLEVLYEATVDGYASPPPIPHFPDQLEAERTREARERGVHVPGSLASSLGWA
jgi:LDH2 family malate/lactate/ureidoglycolate dehydrogenase